MHGVSLYPLKQIHNSKGDILHALKVSSDGVVNFGEAYFSEVKSGEIKGWKKHTKMTLNLIVPIGCIDFVIFNEEDKAFFNITLSRDNYQRLTIEPGLWMAFRGQSPGASLLLNIASIEHDPSEAENRELEEIAYPWS